ncbi:MAG TPA: hypothetical protein VIR33_11715 [Thermopolyspora sp.]
MRAGGDQRGSSRNRRDRRVWLLATFDQDLGPEVARCHLGISERCHGIVDATTLTADRIEPGGTYAHDNIQPACVPCQNRQGALITAERRHQWRAWVEEARQAGIEWDGAMA